MSHTTNTKAGSYLNDYWSFTSNNGDYNSIPPTTVTDTINPATATCTITGFTGPYDGKAHGATGSCTGVNNETPAVNLGATFINVPGGTATWSISDPNYNPLSGSVQITITPIASIVNVNCPSAPQAYTGSALMPCTVTVTDAIGSVLVPAALVYTNNTNVGTATATETYLGDVNHSGNSSYGNFTISGVKSYVTVTCPAAPQPYTAQPQTPCSAKYTTDDGLSGSLTVDYTNNTAMGTATATADYAGDANHNASTGKNTFEISKAVATCTITGFSGPYDGLVHGASGSCTGLPGDDLSTSLNLGATFSDPPGGTATWTFNNPNYETQSKSVAITITRIDVTSCSVTGYTVPYDGKPHSVTGSCTGIGGASLTGLVLPPAHTAAGNYPGEAWSFTNPDYNSVNSTVNDTITRAAPTCTVTPYTISYDGIGHSATGACLGVQGETLSGLNLSGTSHSDVGNYNDAWTYLDSTGNYASANGSVADSILKADAICTVTPYTVSFDGAPHTATGTCTGVLGASLNGLVLSGTTHTNAGDYPNDAWSFNNTSGNYNILNGTVHDSITSPTVTCTVTPYAVLYDGVAHTATGSCTGIGGVAVAGLNLTGTTHTNAGDYPTDTWTFTDPAGNYTSTTGTVHDSITKPTVTCTVTPYATPYDGSSHTATGYCLGTGGVNVAGIDFSGTTHTDAGDYAGDTWTFTDPAGIYTSATGTVHDSITKIKATCSINGYNVTYDGSAHSATGNCTGLGGAGVSGLDLSGTTHTDAGDFTADSWTLKNTDYFASDTVHDIITKTTVTCSIVGFSGVYDGLSHAASGPCVSATGAKLSGLNVGQIYKDVPGGKAGWNFINPNVSNAPLTGSVDITITQAASSVVVTCPASLPQTGSALTPCTAVATGPGGLNQTLTVSYTANIDPGTATASASFAGDGNHTGSSGSSTFTITPGTLAGAPLVGGEGSTVAKNLKGESGAGLDEKSALAVALVTQPPVTTAQVTPTKAVVNSGLGADAKAQNTNNNSSNSKPKSSSFWSTYSGLFGCMGTVFLAMLIFFMFRRRRDDGEENAAENGADNNGPAAT